MCTSDGHLENGPDERALTKFLSPGTKETFQVSCDYNNRIKEFTSQLLIRRRRHNHKKRLDHFIIIISIISAIFT